MRLTIRKISKRGRKLTSQPRLTILLIVLVSFILMSTDAKTVTGHGPGDVAVDLHAPWIKGDTWSSASGSWYDEGEHKGKHKGEGNVDHYAIDWNWGSDDAELRHNKQLLAPASGHVVDAHDYGPGSGKGKAVEINLDADPSITVHFYHLDSILVSKDEHVSTGRVLGYVGKTGLSGDCNPPVSLVCSHIHMGVRKTIDGDSLSPHSVPYKLETMDLYKGIPVPSKNPGPSSEPTRKSFFSIGGWETIYSCKSGSVEVKLDGSTIYSTEPNQVTRWVWAGFHRLEWADPSMDVNVKRWPLPLDCLGIPVPPPPPPPDEGCISSSSLRTSSACIPPSLGVHRAQFIDDITYRDGTDVTPSQSINKTWRLRNSGDSTWHNFRLKFASGDQMGAPASVPVPTTAPGQTVDITVPMTAPSNPRTYRGDWRLVDNQGVTVDVCPPSGGTCGGVWIIVDVKTDSVPPPPGGPPGHITLFDVKPDSPSEATKVHLVGRVRNFDDFRSMRFVLPDGQHEMTNPIQIGDQRQISVDWETGRPEVLRVVLMPSP